MTYKNLAAWNATRNSSKTRKEINAWNAEVTHILVVPVTMEPLDSFPSLAIAKEAVTLGSFGDLYEAK